MFLKDKSTVVCNVPRATQVANGEPGIQTGPLISKSRLLIEDNVAVSLYHHHIIISVTA